MAKARARTIRVDMRGVPIKTGRIRTNREVGLHAASEAAALMDKYVPMRTGALASSANTSQPFRVTYEAPYASYAYTGRGKRFSKEHHPAAMAYWDRPMRNDPSELAASITEFIERM